MRQFFTAAAIVGFMVMYGGSSVEAKQGADGGEVITIVENLPLAPEQVVTLQAVAVGSFTQFNFLGTASPNTSCTLEFKFLNTPGTVLDQLPAAGPGFCSVEYGNTNCQFAHVLAGGPIPIQGPYLAVQV